MPARAERIGGLGHQRLGLLVVDEAVHQQAKPVRANGRRQPVDLLDRIGSDSATRSVVGEGFVALVLDGGRSERRLARFQLRSGPVEFGVELHRNA